MSDEQYESLVAVELRDDVRDNPLAKYLLHLMLIDLSGGLLTDEEYATLRQFQMSGHRKVTP